MKRLRLLVVVVLALAGCGPAIPPVGNYATVSGVVTDRSTNAAIPNATVVIDSVFTAQTDGGGHYRIANVPYGPWSYNASAPSYASVGDTSPPDLLAGEMRSFPIVLSHT